MVDILSDEQREAERICLEAIDICERGEHPQAHELFQKAMELDPSSAKINSWYGYTTALVENKVQRGRDLCDKAIKSQIPDVYFYRNMGKIYLLQGNKRGAIGAFAKGLQIEKNNRAILKEWSALGFRRKPVLGFLSRDHVLNRKLGQFTWWLKHRKDK